jgi:ParB family chromosome partitioning protein
MTTYKKGKLYDINLNDLLADPDQPRKVIDAQALEDMTASVGKLGVIQPIIFRIAADGSKIVVAGERRVAAARNAGLSTIPAIYIADGNYAEVALVENLLRQDLTSVEEAEALQRLMTEQKYTQEQLGVIVGKARTTVGDILTLNKLPLAIRDECRGDRQITRATLIEIARKKQERGMTTAYNAYKAKQQKGKTTRQKKDPNEPQALVDMMDKTMMKIRTIDTSAWTDDDKTNFRMALTSLKTEIDNYLVAPPSQPSKKLA